MTITMVNGTIYLVSSVKRNGANIEIVSIFTKEKSVILVTEIASIAIAG